MALGRAYGSSTFFISRAEMNCSGITRTSKPRALAAGAVLGATVPASAWSAATMLFNACAGDTGLGVARVTVPCTPGAIT
ncbi:hypothetical protein G6F40_017168 [Rhizopus arrhizus]|nr:hypothetical protein G6F40_017168 [Rhizopus arrhizus]